MQEVAGVVSGDGRLGVVPAGEELPEGDQSGVPRQTRRSHLGGGGRSGQGVLATGKFLFLEIICCCYIKIEKIYEGSICRPIQLIFRRISEGIKFL